MFSMRRNLAGGRHWDRSFIKALGFDLLESGFKSVTVKLPIDVDALLVRKGNPEQELAGQFQNREISLQEFVDQERNYPAIILVAVNPELQETMKVLFVNLSRKSAFLDNTFPSGHSIPSQLYVQSPDGGRLYSLFHFFYEYLNQGGQSFVGRVIVGLLAFFFVAAEMIAFISTGRGLLQVAWGISGGFDVLALLTMLFMEYRFFASPTGASVNDRSTATTASFVQRAFRGEFKDNPVVNLVLSVIAAIFAAFVMRLLGWP